MTEGKILQFKWGTLKGWSGVEGRAFELLEKYFADGMPMSCAMDHPDDDRRKILCDLIDEFEGEFYLDWDGKYITKDEAKKYVMEYGK